MRTAPERRTNPPLSTRRSHAACSAPASPRLIPRPRRGFALVGTVGVLTVLGVMLDGMAQRSAIERKRLMLERAETARTVAFANVAAVLALRYETPARHEAALRTAVSGVCSIDPGVLDLAVRFGRNTRLNVHTATEDELREVLAQADHMPDALVSNMNEALGRHGGTATRLIVQGRREGAFHSYRELAAFLRVRLDAGEPTSLPGALAQTFALAGDSSTQAEARESNARLSPSAIAAERTVLTTLIVQRHGRAASAWTVPMSRTPSGRWQARARTAHPVLAETSTATNLLSHVVQTDC